MSNRKPMDPKSVAVFGVSIALVAALTSIFLPIPATRGYFNLGEVVIFFLAFTFGRWKAAIAGAIGAAIMDALVAPHFIPATLIAKFVEGLTAGTIVMILKGASNPIWARTLGFSIGGTLMVITYFLYEVFILPLGLSTTGGLGPALVELPFNILQVVLCGIIALATVEGIERAYPRVADLYD
jgi:uncharacterized membrane protein